MAWATGIIRITASWAALVGLMLTDVPPCATSTTAWTSRSGLGLVAPPSAVSACGPWSSMITAQWPLPGYPGF
jgi:hypothetical protein